MNDAPQWMMYAQTLLALAFVVGLIFICAALARKAGFGKRFGAAAAGKHRMQIVETLYLDPRRKLVLVRLDREEHLLLVGQNAEQVISRRESGGGDDGV